MPLMSIAELEALIAAHFPDAQRLGTVTALAEGTLTLRMPFRKTLARPGGTISGPAMMLLADTAAYFVTLAHVGPHPQMATANLDIHFLARPEPVDVIATARLLRVGRRLAVSTVEICSEGSAAVVAHATVTYALPARD